MRRRIALRVFLLSICAAAFAEDAGKPVPAEFLTDVAAAQAKAKTQGKPLVVVVAPKWFASPEVARLEKDVLTDADVLRALTPFVRVRAEETADREVHARHRVRFQGYPLVVVLDADGAFLGSTSGLPAEDVAKTWALRVASIPPRAAKMKELRAVLVAKPEDPQTLFDLALLHVEAGDEDRAVPLFERMEAADPDCPADRLGEARYQVIRISVVRAMADRRFADVDPVCQKWLRRFAAHARAPDVSLLQANALYLAGEKDRAKEIWKTLVDKSAGTDAARRARTALDSL